jgi:hypothetical protein
MHLLFSISSHGYGHLAQSVPIVEALAARLPGLRVTVRTGLPEAVVRRRMRNIGTGVDVLPTDDDFGFVMRDALTVDDAATLERYRMLHADFDTRQDRERDRLRSLAVDFAFSNIGYEVIAAARSIGLPAFAGCSLDWGTLFLHRFPGARDRAIGEAMRAAYASATRLFELVPGMPLDLPGAIRVAPIGRTGVSRAAELRRLLAIDEASKLMVVAFGGTPMPLATDQWRLPPGWRALVFAPQVAQSDAVMAPPPALADWPFADVVASCDVLVAKPGYGTFVEAGFVGRPTLIVPRNDWPEAPYLVDWLSRHARCVTLPVDALTAGDFGDALLALDAQPPRVVARGDGAREIAEAVARELGAAAPAAPAAPAMGQ